MKIALFLPTLCCGGAERVMVNLARGFAERGLEVDLVLARAEGPYLAEVPKDVHIVDLNARRLLRSLPGLVHYLRRERPVAMISTLNHANIIAIWARQMAKAPLVLIIREDNTMSVSAANELRIRDKLLPHLMQLFYPWANEVIAVSHGVAEDLIERIGLPAEKVKVIYNPIVTPDLFIKAQESLDHPWFRSGEPPVILGVGRLTKQKDFSSLIHAFALVRKERPARLMILNEGEERPRLEALVRELGLEQDVALPGFVDSPYKYMKRAAVFVLSSKYEGLGNVLVEAMACGTPVVATDCPSGPAEILGGGKWGRLVAVGDVNALAQAIFRTLDAPISAGIEDIEIFTLDYAVARYAEIMEFGK
jgi:glycosyltransferase involved in cell wall biosynthesis